MSCGQYLKSRISLTKLRSQLSFLFNSSMVTFSSSSGVQYRLGTTTVDSIMLFAENHVFHITFISLFDFRKNRRLKVAIQY